jgi:hypothetical protein
MADDLSSISTVAISSAGEALREFKHPPEKRRERAKGPSIALENLAEEESVEDETAEEEERLLDVSA